jgi:hypothetical protein
VDDGVGGLREEEGGGGGGMSISFLCRALSTIANSRVASQRCTRTRKKHEHRVCACAHVRAACGFTG